MNSFDIASGLGESFLTRYIFVYGTLRKSMSNHKAYELNKRAVLVGTYVIPGFAMYYTSTAKNYPAAIIDRNKFIVGELYDLAPDINKTESYNTQMLNIAEMHYQIDILEAIGSLYTPMYLSLRDIESNVYGTKIYLLKDSRWTKRELLIPNGNFVNPNHSIQYENLEII